MLKCFVRNYWYDVFLRWTYFRTIRTRKVFDANEINQIKNSFRKLIQTNRAMLGDVYSEFHLSWCSAILATYRACLVKNMEKQDAIEFTAAVIFENMQADAIANRIRAMLNKAKDPFMVMVNASKHHENKFFGNTFQFSRMIDNDSQYQAVFHKCFFNDYFHNNGVPELMKIACAWDLISWSKGIDPEKHRLTFSRPVSLGLNGKDCSFTFNRL
jgi:hypothetical protein